jgi:apolipoprotein D and lipocalin family protein
VRALPAALLLGACAVAPGYRDRDVAMTSVAALDVGRYAGRWYEVARFPAPLLDGCGAAVAEYTAYTDRSLSVVNSCAGADRRAEARALPAGPGRFELRLDGETEPYWVLWVDEGYRTAVVGMPSGRGAWILNRDPEIPADRLRAAREVLTWNGYDVSQLRMVRR